MRRRNQPILAPVDHQDRSLELTDRAECVERVPYEGAEQQVPAGHPAHTGEGGLEDQGGD